MRPILTAAAAALLLGSAAFVLVNGSSRPAIAHDENGAQDAHHDDDAHDEDSYSAGEPGDPTKPARIVHVTMREADGKMLFDPNRIEVREGEQIHFIIQNSGTVEHEFMLASVEDNDKHAELMKKYPQMEHDDPNAKSLSPNKTDEIFWKFSKQGEFEFACLIPGHREAGMRGTVVVK